MRRFRESQSLVVRSLALMFGSGSLLLLAASWPLENPSSSASRNRLIPMIVRIGNSGVTSTPTIPVTESPGCRGPRTPGDGDRRRCGPGGAGGRGMPGSGSIYASPWWTDMMWVSMLGGEISSTGGGGLYSLQGSVIRLDMAGPGGNNPGCKVLPPGWDLMRGGGGGGSGCGTCSGGGPLGSGGDISGNMDVLMQVPPLNFNAVFRPQKAPNFGGGLAPGMELEVWGSNVYVGKNTQQGANEIIIQLNDTTDGEIRNFFDSTYGSSADGVCYDKQKVVKYAELRTGGANGTLTTSMTDADTVVVTYYSGVRMEFELLSYLP